MTRHRQRRAAHRVSIALSGAALVALLGPHSAFAGGRNPIQASYTLEISATKHRGCISGGTSLSLSGALKLSVNDHQARLVVDTKTSSTSYQSRRQPMRTSHSSSVLNKTYKGSVKPLPKGWLFTFNLATPKATKTQPKTFAMRCQMVTLKVRPATKAGQRVTTTRGVPGSRLLTAQVLRCSSSGLVPQVIRDAHLKGRLHLGEGKGIKLVSSSHHATTRGIYYAR
ncbi:MAG: hypothetical protein CSA65_02200 [Proteobacteria bacterium]|nr:MAG: hypothetical protein CSA65_02200 [Pseudomonadota bacterium]